MTRLPPEDRGSDARLAAVFTAPDEAARREAAAALRESDWQRLAATTFTAGQLEAAAERPPRAGASSPPRTPPETAP